MSVTITKFSLDYSAQPRLGLSRVVPERVVTYTCLVCCPNIHFIAYYIGGKSIPSGSQSFFDFLSYG
jgi:hypothetical protein